MLNLKKKAGKGFNIPVEIGDVILTGKFKNKKIEVKEFGTDAKGQPTVNNRVMLTFRIQKLIPDA